MNGGRQAKNHDLFISTVLSRIARTTRAIPLRYDDDMGTVAGAKIEVRDKDIEILFRSRSCFFLCSWVSHCYVRPLSAEKRA